MAGERLNRSLSLYRDLDDRRGVAEVTDDLGGVARERGDYTQARMLHEESLALWRELGDEHGIAGSLYYLGLVAWLNGEHRAGIKALSTRNFPDDRGPLREVAP
jgi:Tetratricopeptide repeat